MKWNITHGQSGTPTYRSWNAMIGRCYRPTTNGFERYGARGVTVCDRWRESFPAFLEDMGERPPGTTLDRLDNAKGYEPGNCRWATGSEQRRSAGGQRPVRLITWGDTTDSILGWSKRTGLDRAVIDRRLRLAWPVERVLTAPSMTPRETTDFARAVRDGHVDDGDHLDALTRAERT